MVAMVVFFTEEYIRLPIGYRLVRDFSIKLLIARTDAMNMGLEFVLSTLFPSILFVLDIFYYMLREWSVECNGEPSVPMPCATIFIDRIAG